MCCRLIFLVFLWWSWPLAIHVKRILNRACAVTGLSCRSKRVKQVLHVLETRMPPFLRFLVSSTSRLQYQKRFLVLPQPINMSDYGDSHGAEFAPESSNCKGVGKSKNNNKTSVDPMLLPISLPISPYDFKETTQPAPPTSRPLSERFNANNQAKQPSWTPLGTQKSVSTRKAVVRLHLE